MTPATRPSTGTPLRAATASASRAWAPWRSLCESRISSPVATTSVCAVMAYVETRHARALLTAILLLPVGLVFDVLDGRVARWRQRHSAMGRELDSLADVISFGVAPAALAYGAGMRGGWDVVVLVYFVCCGVSRLARFNVTAESLSAETGKVKYFEGTPIPSSLL